tara:strand:- start:332 stop:547 length:216 start_codon:yes stop_codon:yes gene_type:complete
MIENIKLMVIESFDEDFEVISIEKKFEDYDGWDSLTAMVLIDKISSEFNVDIEITDINEMSVSKLNEILTK